MTFTPKGCCFRCNDKQRHPVVAAEVEKHFWQFSISNSSALRDGWRNPLHHLHRQWFWHAGFAQKHTDQTCLRWCLCRLHLHLSAPLIELHLSNVSVESCGQTAPEEPSESSWHSSPEFWTRMRNKKQTCDVFTHGWIQYLQSYQSLKFCSS